MMTIKISIKSILEWILPMVFILPYIEISKIMDLFDIKTEQGYLPASIIIMIPFIIVYALACPKKVALPIGIKRIFQLLSFLSVYMIINTFFSLQNPSYSIELSIFQLLYFLVPVIYAKTIIKYILSGAIDNIDRFVKRGVVLFSGYLFICTIINISKYGFSISSQSRLISPGGGAVILGYTISLIIAFVYSSGFIQDKKLQILVGIICAVSSLFTGSRGGIWPTLIILVLIIVSQKRKINPFVVMIMFFLALIIDPIEAIANIFPRFLKATSTNRIMTQTSGWIIFKAEKLWNKLFGFGIGNVFPYQIWKINRRDSRFIASLFFFKGEYMLVEPHNTYIYLLLECGLMGLIMFFSTMFTMVKESFKKKSETIFPFLTVFVFILLGIVEGTIFFQPGSAGLWWLVVMLSCISISAPFRTNQINNTKTKE